MVFKAKDARTFKVKVTIPTRNEGKPRTFSTGSTVKAVALDVERMVNRMKARRQWEGLEVVFDDQLTLAEVYDADTRGTLSEKLAELRDIDIEPFVEEWKKRADAKYVRQVRRLIVEGERFPRSAFRKSRIKSFLDDMECDDPTRNRYRAALSSFARWLMDKEVLEFNPARAVEMYAENDPRTVWMTWKEAQAVADAAEEPHRTLFALMAATGIELGAALVLTVHDVDTTERTIHAHGTKRASRNRVARYEPWAAPYIVAHCKSLVGFAPLFPGLNGDEALDLFKAAQKAVGIDGHRLHDLRHTYAVNALRKGYKPQVVATQLGHINTAQVNKCYGRFVPDASDYEVTNSVTSAKKPREVKRAK